METLVYLSHENYELLLMDARNTQRNFIVFGNLRNI